MKAIEFIAAVDPVSVRIAVDRGERDRPYSAHRSDRTVARDRPERVPDEDQVLFDFRLIEQRAGGVTLCGQVAQPRLMLAPFEGPFQGLGQFFAAASDSARSSSPTTPAAHSTALRRTA